ncbi:MAG: DegV family protein [Corynebacterium sp.]|nr:DegV family protein [Corynebacterium sp.]
MSDQVQIVTDSSANLPAWIAENMGIIVVDLHTLGKASEATTAGLSALELTAVYARALERGGDRGVVAIHIGKELSHTWANAVTAAGVFEKSAVRVVDTDAAGMGLGMAALMAATKARAGEDLQACAEAAAAVLEHTQTFIYVHKLDALRKSGRLSTTTKLSAALTARPIFRLRDGSFELAGKARTGAKAMVRLTELIAAETAEEPVTVAIQQYEAREMAAGLARQVRAAVPVGSTVFIVDISEALAVHTGPGAIAVSIVQSGCTNLPVDN